MGTNQRHDNPFLCNIGSGTMVSDGLSMINMDMSATVVPARRVEDRRAKLSRQRHPLSAERQDRRERPARHQDHDPDRRTGARERRPARIAGVRDSAHGRSRPRHERVDRRGDAPRAPAPEERLQLRDRRPVPAVPLDGVLRRAGALDGRDCGLRHARRACAARRRRPRSPARTSCSSSRSSARACGFKRLVPKLASIYDPYFWSHERHWKLSDSPIIALFAGTPFRNIMMRAHRHEGRQDGVRLQPVDHRAHADRGRRLREPERRRGAAGAFAGRRRVQVRPHPHGQRLLDRSGRVRPLRRPHGRPRRARRRLLPDEGRGARLAHRLARQSGQDDAQLCGRRPRTRREPAPSRTRRCGSPRSRIAAADRAARGSP